MRSLSLAFSVAICSATLLGTSLAGERNMFGEGVQQRDLFGEGSAVAAVPHVEASASQPEVAPILCGTAPGGLITDYAEGYRQAVYGGCNLTVVVGLPDREAERIAASAAEGEIVCLGSLKQFRRGVYRYVQTPEGLRLSSNRMSQASHAGPAVDVEPQLEYRASSGCASCAGGRCRIR